jgi:hypothetical protein
VRVVLRTHGGLGNQIFQVLFARLYAEQCDASLHEIHDANYNHNFARSLELGRRTERISYTQRLLSSLRLPKVLHRIGWGADERISLFGTVYLDGYFQAAYHYRSFDPKRVADQLNRIRNEFKILLEDKCGLLIHLRLGDFFSSANAAKLHVIERLRDLRPGSTIITNQESLLRDPELESMLCNIGCVVQSTEGFSPEAILRLMAQFDQIDANDSTLSFWASVLGESRVEFVSPMLIETHSLFKSILNP